MCIHNFFLNYNVLFFTSFTKKTAFYFSILPHTSMENVSNASKNYFILKFYATGIWKTVPTERNFFLLFVFELYFEKLKNSTLTDNNNLNSILLKNFLWTFCYCVSLCHSNSTDYFHWKKKPKTKMQFQSSYKIVFNTGNWIFLL